jgi:NCAIR mutase (PurE)-related protein
VTDPFSDFRQALATVYDDQAGADIRIDSDRQTRTGIPEVILAEHKTVDQVSQAAQRILETADAVIITRVRDDQLEVLRAVLGEQFEFWNDCRGRVIAASKCGTQPPKTGGRIGIVAAGTSDIGASIEATVMAQQMGCEVFTVTDVGVAGLHRLVAPLRDLMAREPDAIVVAAGMDGALPSVVAGLVDVPVIGLPVSTGYGLGGDGVAALYSMLQACAPGLAVVNIDNGVGAGSMAALIANRAAQARTR